MVTKYYKVYGINGHRQRYSFFESNRYDWSEGDNIRIVEMRNADITGTNDFTEVLITMNTAKECDEELIGQISDGLFEDCNVGRVEGLEEWSW